jgi:translation initiation factor 5A
MAEEENFEKGDAGSSLTYTKQASHLKKGDFAMLKGNPCKVLEMTTAKVKYVQIR